MDVKIVAVVVTFFPEMELLQSLLESVSSQVDHVILIDNGTLTEPQQRLLEQGAQMIRLPQNVGLAAAQNHGITIAQKLCADFVLILDQDSVPCGTMVEELTAAYNRLSFKYAVAAVGAAYSKDGGSFVRLSGLSLKRVDCPSDDVVAVDHLISSGSLLNLSALTKIGLMNEKLFIDLIDTEWSIRAKHLGFTLWGVGSAVMTHCLGERSMNVFGRNLPIHKPFRYYYIIRNGMILALSNSIPSRWRLVLFIRTIKVAILFSIFPRGAVGNFKMILLGLRDGIMRKHGKLD
jgi:rhamnosyltransferase